MNAVEPSGVMPWKEVHVFARFIREEVSGTGMRVTDVADTIARMTGELSQFVIRTANTQNTVRIYVKMGLSPEDERRFEWKLRLIVQLSLGHNFNSTPFAGWVLWYNPEDCTTKFEML